VNRYLKFEGFCPYIGKNRIIKVEYISAVNFDNPNAAVKGIDFICSDKEDCKQKKSCPIRKAAPDNTN
jgi:hypothetical protein